MRAETDLDYITADRILEDGDSRWFRQRIARALRAEREACGEAATALNDDFWKRVSSKQGPFWVSGALDPKKPESRIRLNVRGL